MELSENGHCVGLTFIRHVFTESAKLKSSKFSLMNLAILGDSDTFIQ